MNLTGYGWVEDNVYHEVVDSGPFKELDMLILIRSREMKDNGADYNSIWSVNSVVTRIQSEILDEIDELGYAYEHQDWERKGEVIKELLTLRGYLVDA